MSGYRMRGAPRRVARRMKRAAIIGGSNHRKRKITQRERERMRKDDLAKYMRPLNNQISKGLNMLGICFVVFTALAVGAQCITGSAGGSASVPISDDPTADQMVATAWAGAPTDTPTPTPRATLTPTPRLVIQTGAIGSGTDIATAEYVADTHATVTSEGSGAAKIGGTLVPSDLRCYEDEPIYFINWLGGEYANIEGAPIGCVHYEYFAIDFVLECLIGNSEYGTNNASEHLRDPNYGSWCSDVIDNSSDGVVSIGDLLTDTARIGRP